MIMCTDVERVSSIPAIAANCESTSESDEHLLGDRDSEGHEDIRVSEVKQNDDSDEPNWVGLDMWERLIRLVRLMMMRLVRLI